MPRVVPRVRKEMRGRRLGMQALMTPLEGSAADQMAELTQSPVVAVRGGLRVMVMRVRTCDIDIGESGEDD